MIEGEFCAMSELYKVAPAFTPRPHLLGTCPLGSDTAHFLLSQWIDMENSMPEPNQLCSKSAQLHLNSASPTDQFGFHVATCQGRTLQAVDWARSWTTFFAALLRRVTRLDFEINGDWDALQKLEERVISDVIPRLIGILEEDGRSVKPSLIHADLWEGNIGTNSESGDIFIFDPASFYAHNEMEIGAWRCHYNNICDPVYPTTYRQHYKPSKPVDEWADRNRLYSVYYNIIYSVNHGSKGMEIRKT